MAKPFGTCALCGAPHFLNHAGLCKRCNAKDESLAIRGESLLHEQEAERFKEQSRAEETTEPEEPQEEPDAQEPSEEQVKQS